MTVGANHPGSMQTLLLKSAISEYRTFAMHSFASLREIRMPHLTTDMREALISFRALAMPDAFQPLSWATTGWATPSNLDPSIARTSQIEPSCAEPRQAEKLNRPFDDVE
jgi:hypothetical protein